MKKIIDSFFEVIAIILGIPYLILVAKIILLQMDINEKNKTQNEI